MNLYVYETTVIKEKEAIDLRRIAFRLVPSVAKRQEMLEGGDMGGLEGGNG